MITFYLRAKGGLVDTTSDERLNVLSIQTPYSGGEDNCKVILICFICAIRDVFVPHWKVAVPKAPGLRVSKLEPEKCDSHLSSLHT